MPSYIPAFWYSFIFLNEGIPPHFSDPISQRDDIRPSVVCSMHGDVLSNEANSFWEINIVTLSPQQTKESYLWELYILIHIRANDFSSDHLSEPHLLRNLHLITAHIWETFTLDSSIYCLNSQQMTVKIANHFNGSSLEKLSITHENRRPRRALNIHSSLNVTLSGKVLKEFGNKMFSLKIIYGQKNAFYIFYFLKKTKFKGVKLLPENNEVNFTCNRFLFHKQSSTQGHSSQSRMEQ